MISPELQRLKDVIFFLKKKKLLKDQQEIAQYTDYAYTTVSEILNGKQPLTEKFIKIFCREYKVNSDFIIKGVGEILVGEEYNHATKDENHVEKGEPEFYNRKMTGFYYPDVSAAAGLEKAIENSELTKIPIYIPSFGQGLSFVNVYGDSMYPKFCSGEVIGITEVEKDYVIFGHAYVVVLNDGQVFIKYIRKGKDDNHWILASENVKYENKEFNISKIRKVFIVKGVITKLTM